ncbi:MAG: hypothetical protein MHMPM18_001277 [Marteilia pararefringens]
MFSSKICIATIILSLHNLPQFSSDDAGNIDKVLELYCSRKCEKFYFSLALSLNKKLYDDLSPKYPEIEYDEMKYYCNVRLYSAVTLLLFIFASYIVLVTVVVVLCCRSRN